MTNPDTWVLVAVVGKPHALAGGVTVRPFTRTGEDFLEIPLESVRVRRAGKIEGTLTINRITLHGGVPIIFFQEITDRNGAEDLRGAELVIHEDERWELPDGQFYADDLVGLDVVEETTGHKLGQIKRADEGSAHDYLVIPHPERPGKELMIPLVKQFVLRIDPKGGEVVVRLPEGLLDV